VTVCTFADGQTTAWYQGWHSRRCEGLLSAPEADVHECLLAAPDPTVIRRRVTQPTRQRAIWAMAGSRARVTSRSSDW